LRLRFSQIGQFAFVRAKLSEVVPVRGESGLMSHAFTISNLQENKERL
jgi:hypothetical protein